MSLGAILIIVLILILLGVIPTWPHSKNWGYYPSVGFFFAKILLAFVLIFASLDELNLPFLFISDALAFAFAACFLSGIGYFFSAGKPYSFLGIFFLFAAVNFTMMNITLKFRFRSNNQS